MRTFVKHFAIATILLIGFVLFSIIFQGVSLTHITVGYLVQIILYSAVYCYSLYFLNTYLHHRARLLLKKTEIKSSLFWFYYLIFIIAVNSFAVYLIAQILSGSTHDYSRILAISLIIGFLFYSYYYIFNFFQKKNKEQELSIAKISRSESAAKSQIGAHFLFNSLNILNGLIDENPKKAQNFITDMAEVYRYILDESEKNWTQSKDEIKFAEKYLNLIQIRFEDSLEIYIEPEIADSELYLAPLTLQLLLENIIKHNALSREKKLKIEIYQENDFLIVKNTLNPKSILQKRKGKGLQNIINQYTSVDKKVIVQESATHFTVKIPLLKTI
ncbi:sensor histidine kinase [Ornithobacterium rhinotracheale]|uniref:sensor histidine kinase n=1 Tax=Ornithobacterium rhinotracheale TaxID=28251 RepID=UPI003FA46BE8